MRLPFLTALALGSLLPFAAMAQDRAEPRFVVVPNHFNRSPRAPSGTLPQWTANFTDLTGKIVRYRMVGTNPTNTNSSTTIPVVLVPVRMVYGKANGHRIFDPRHVLPNGRTVVRNAMDSPLFQSGIDFVQDGVDVGNTQYLDAYQRANFWYNVEKNTNYHILLGQPTVLTERTINVPATEGYVMDNPFAQGKVGTMDIDAFDAKLQSFISSYHTQINPGVLPVFLTFNIFLTSNGCCIGGYHSANGGPPGGQTYAYATYVGSEGSFAQDVSALSHEIGEWIDDPFIDNHVNCTNNYQLMEVGDPLEGGPNYGAWRYYLNGFWYDLQSLVFIDYFGAQPSHRLNNWYSFQDDEWGVCPGQ